MAKTEELALTADVPDLRLFQIASPAELAQAVYSKWGWRPGAWAVPLLTPEGPCFDNTLGGDVIPIRCWDGAERTLPDLVAALPEPQRSGDVFLVVDPHLTFVNIDTIHIEDICGEFSAQACVCNPKVQEILARLLIDAVGALKRAGTGGRLGGVCIDCVDLWPMSASGPRLELTCFCGECERQFGQRNVNMSDFRQFPNPWNICLRDSGSGINYIDDIPYGDPATTDLQARIDRTAKLSKLKGFSDALPSVGDLAFLNLTEKLMAYVDARDAMTRAALDRVFASVVGEVGGVQRVVITEGSQYDWTSGMFLEGLDKSGVCDELWFDPSSNRSKTYSVQNRCYLWRRSRYHIDAFFDSLSHTTNLFMLMSSGLSRLAGPELDQLLAERRQSCLAQELKGKLSLAALPDDRKRAALVCATLTDGLVERLQQSAMPKTRPKTARDMGVRRQRKKRPEDS